MEPAAISASPPVMTMAVELAMPESPAASAKGTVSPSDIPITMSRTTSEPVKCCSTCGICGIVSSQTDIGRSPIRPAILLSAKLTQGAQQADYVVSGQDPLNLVSHH